MSLRYSLILVIPVDQISALSSCLEELLELSFAVDYHFICLPTPEAKYFFILPGISSTPILIHTFAHFECLLYPTHYTASARASAYIFMSVEFAEVVFHTSEEAAPAQVRCYDCQPSTI